MTDSSTPDPTLDELREAPHGQYGSRGYMSPCVMCGYRHRC